MLAYAVHLLYAMLSLLLLAASSGLCRFGCLRFALQGPLQRANLLHLVHNFVLIDFNSVHQIQGVMNTHAVE